MLSVRCVLVAVAVLYAVQRASAQPAPALSQIYVTQVASNKAYDRTVPVGAISTPSDHSGTILQIEVLEVGYAANNSQIARFNGQPMSLIRSTPRLDAARRIVGYWRIYEYRGAFTSGTFTYSASSLVFPFRTVSTRLFIR